MSIIIDFVASRIPPYLLAHLQSVDPIFFAYIALCVMAVLPIYFGSLLALEDIKKEEAEKVSSEDAYLFPVIGSVVLFSAWLVLKYLPKEYLNYFLNAYFAPVGTAAAGQVLVHCLTTVLPAYWTRYAAHTLSLTRDSDKKIRSYIKITWPAVFSYVASALLVTVYLMSGKHWVLSNILGLALAITAIEAVHLDSFRTGFILLAGLFVYDIFWVFGTEVMVSVAKNFDLPIKLLFPRDIKALWTTSDPSLLERILSTLSLNRIAETAQSITPVRFSMLGLGDIVVPGIFIALCLRFDQHNKSKWFPYFRFTMLAYIAGLICTITVMHVFSAAQPALLYLSPACSLTPLIIALLRGQLSLLLSFHAGEVRPITNAKKNE